MKQKIFLLLFLCLDGFGSDAAVYYVNTQNDLVNVLQITVAGDLVNVTGVIDMTGYSNIIIPAGVTLKGNYDLFSNPGGTEIFSESYYDITEGVSTGQPVFNMKTGSVIMNIKFRGPKPEYKQQVTQKIKTTTGALIAGPQEGGSMCIKMTEAGCKVYGCEFFGWDHKAIWCYHPGDQVIDRCYFHHCKLIGFGYGIWVGGKGNSGNLYCVNPQYFIQPIDLGTTRISNCIFENNQEDIDSQSSRFSWYADYCSISRIGMGTHIARHPGAVDNISHVWNGSGYTDIPKSNGDSVSITNSIFYDTDRIGGFCFPNVNQNPNDACIENAGKIIFKNCQFARAKDEFCNPGRYIEQDGQCLTPGGGYFPDIIQLDSDGDCTYGAMFHDVPVARIQCEDAGDPSIDMSTDSAAVKTGAVITFYPDQSQDCNGGLNSPNLAYIYRFNQDTVFYTDQLISPATVIDWPFYKIGTQVVSLHVVDNSNFLCSDIDYRRFYVMPIDNEQHLTFWLKDCYEYGTSPTGIKVRVSLNGNLLLDMDVAEIPRGWNYYDFIVTGMFNTGSTVKDSLGFELSVDVPASPVDVRGVTLWIDDVYINTSSGTNYIRIPDFEDFDNAFTSSNWRRKSYVSPEPGIPANKLTKITTGSVEDEFHSGMYAGYITLRHLNDGMITDGRMYPAGSYGRMWQTFKFSSAARLSDDQQAPEWVFRILQNPMVSNGKLGYEWITGEEQEEGTLDIMDETGRTLLLTHPIFPGRQEVAAGLSPGVYLVKFTGSGKTATRKLVVTE